MKKITKRWVSVLSVIMAILIATTNLPIYASEELSGENNITVSVPSESGQEQADENSAELQSQAVTTQETEQISGNTEENAQTSQNSDQTQSETTQTTEQNALQETEQIQPNGVTMLRSADLTGVRTLGGATLLGGSLPASLRVNIKLLNIVGTTTNEDTDFRVGNLIEAGVDISVSGATLEHPWILITIPKTDKISRPIFTDSQIPGVKTIVMLEQDPNNYYVLYKYDQIAGGANFQYKFPFEFVSNYANDGDTITVRADILDARDALNKNDINPNNVYPTISSLTPIFSDTKTYKAIKSNYPMNDSVAKPYQEKSTRALNAVLPNTTDNTVFDYDVQADASQTTTGDLGYRLPIAFAGTVTSPLPSDLTGMERVNNLKIVATLPEGVTPIIPDGDNKASFNPATREFTIFDTNPRINDTTDTDAQANGVVHKYRFLFKNKNFNEVYSIPTRYTVNSGYPTQRNLPDRVANISLTKIPFSPAGSFGVYKDNLSGADTEPIIYNVTEGRYTIAGGRIYDLKNDQTENGLFYTIRIGNANNGSSAQNPLGGTVSEVSKIYDHAIRENANYGRVYYKAFTIGEASAISSDVNVDDATMQQEINNLINQINNTNNVLYGVKADGTRAEIRRNIKYKEKIDIEDTAATYTHLSLEFDTPIRFNNTKIMLYVQTYPTAAEVAKYTNGQYRTRHSYYGKVDVEYKNVNLTTGASTPLTTYSDNGALAFTSLEPISPRSFMTASGNRVINYRAIGTPVYHDSSFRFNHGLWGVMAERPLDDVKIMLLLPPAFDYKRKVSQALFADDVGQPLVIENYKGTGRTAVIYTANNVIPNDTTRNRLSIRTEITATPQAKPGNNELETFVIYPNNDIIIPYISADSYDDALDIDDDTNTNEQFLRKISLINFVIPNELLIKKQVGNDSNSLGVFSTVDLGKEFVYEISAINNTIHPVENLSFIDVLPYRGDHSIVGNAGGSYFPRNSVYTVALSKAIEEVVANATLLTRFDIEYQLTPQGVNLESVRDGAWVPRASITDFSQVKSFRIKLKSGSSVAPGEEIKILIPVKMPTDTSLTPGDTAVNSIAISYDNERSYSEGNSVRVTFPKYQVKGVYFNDANQNSNRDTSEEGIKNALVELIDVNTGQPALDLNGMPITTTTDRNGNYSFDIYRRGDYQVRFTKKNGENFTTLGNRDTSNHIATSSNNTGLTNTFTLTPTNAIAIRNGGLVKQTRDITIYKIDDERTQTGDEIPLQDAEFSIVVNGITRTATTNSSGIADFLDVPYGTTL